MEKECLEFSLKDKYLVMVAPSFVVDLSCLKKAKQEDIPELNKGLVKKAAGVSFTNK